MFNYTNPIERSKMVFLQLKSKKSENLMKKLRLEMVFLQHKSKKSENLMKKAKIFKISESPKYILLLLLLLHKTTIN